MNSDVRVGSSPILGTNINNPKFNKIMIFDNVPIWKEISKEKYEYEENKTKKIIEAKGGDIITECCVWESFYHTYKKEPIYKEGVDIIEMIKIQMLILYHINIINLKESII